jgi:SET domain-containing protein 6
MGIVSLGYDISAPIAPPDTVHMLSPELVILVETLTLSGDQFARYKKSNKLPKANLSPSCAELLCQVLRARAAQYPTTVETDFIQISHFRTEGSPAQSVSERRKRMAMKVRHGEKKILDNAMSALNAIVWQTPTNQSEKRTDESMDTGSNKRRKI